MGWTTSTGNHWHNLHRLGHLEYLESGKGKKVGFSLRPLLDQDLSEEEAVAAALRKAKAHREELVRKGILKPEQGQHSTVRE